MPPVGFEPTISAGERPQTSTRNAELKNEWSYTSAPPVCICGIHRDSAFSFTVCEAEAVNFVDMAQNDPQLYLL